MRYFAGIGSRKTPKDILVLMSAITHYCYTKSYVLRSGGAEGADTAFEKGLHKKGAPHKSIFYAWDATSKSIEYAKSYYNAQNFDNKSKYVKQLLGRNAMIILGANLDIPVKFVVCWTPKGEIVGGTGLGIKIAQKHNIPVYNLAKKEVYIRIRNTLGIPL